MERDKRELELTKRCKGIGENRQEIESVRAKYSVGHLTFGI